jgi:hypothetical protein
MGRKALGHRSILSRNIEALSDKVVKNWLGSGPQRTQIRGAWSMVAARPVSASSHQVGLDRTPGICHSYPQAQESVLLFRAAHRSNKKSWSPVIKVAW